MRDTQRYLRRYNILYSMIYGALNWCTLEVFRRFDYLLYTKFPLRFFCGEGQNSNKSRTCVCNKICLLNTWYYGANAYDRARPTKQLKTITTRHHNQFSVKKYNANQIMRKYLNYWTFHRIHRWQKYSVELFRQTVKNLSYFLLNKLLIISRCRKPTGIIKSKNKIPYERLNILNTLYRIWLWKIALR